MADNSFWVRLDVVAAESLAGHGKTYRLNSKIRIDADFDLPNQPPKPVRWLCIGRPDPHLLRIQSGEAKFVGTNCLLSETSGRPIAALIGFSYDVISGPLVLDRSYLASICHTKGPQLVPVGSGSWTTVKHEYSHEQAAMLFTDDAGNNVLDRFGNLMYRPPQLDPKVILQAAVVRKFAEKDMSKAKAALDPLDANFRTGGAWDAQRINGGGKFGFYTEYQDFATVLIGIYFAGKGAPLDSCLTVQNGFAFFKTTHGAGVRMDPTYTNLPIRNVDNTKIGYQLVQSGRIRPIVDMQVFDRQAR